MGRTKVNAIMRVKVDRARTRRYAEKVGREGAEKAATITAMRAKWIIASEGRVRTGAMLLGVHVEQDGPKGFQVVSPANYSVFQEKGVRPFSARPGKVLAFRPKGSRTMVFRKRVKGFPGIHFLERALKELRVRDFT